MPCTDITEILQIELDSDDRLVYYALHKGSCGGSVGKPSLLKRWVRERPARDILANRPEEFLRRLNLRSDTWEFLHLKHLLAIQSGLRALQGDDTRETASPCEVHSVEHIGDRVRLTAAIRIDLITEAIRACNACGAEQ